MSNPTGASSFDARDIDARQLFVAAIPKISLGGPNGILDDSTLYFRQNNSANQLFTKNGGYHETRQGITAMLYIQEDEDFVRPTSYALDLTLDLLEDTNAELITQGSRFPKGVPSTTEKGGLYIFWKKNGVSIQLEVPHKEGGMYYIHVISHYGSSMNRIVSAKTLADALAASSLSHSQRLGTMNAPASATAR